MNGARSLPEFRLRSPAAAIAWEIFRRQRATVFAVLAAVALCAVYRTLTSTDKGHDPFFTVCLVLIGISFGATFNIFKFTESDRRDRFTGYPARLFVMPVRTWTLVMLPILYGVIAVVLVYAAWAVLVMRPLVHNQLRFRIGFPSLYLATAMICFQAIVWSLARFPLTRLIALGVWGSALATGWMAFSPVMDRAQLGTALAELLHVSVSTIQVSYLSSMSVVGFGVAWWSVSRQRAGANFQIAWPRFDFIFGGRRTPRRFSSVRSAQFWFEWRRNGQVLPMIVGVLLLLIVAPFLVIVPLAGRISAGLAMATVCWILALPFVLAFFIGQGFGKTNFWSQGLGKGMGVPLFLAMRPIATSDWIAVKLKTAALSAAVTWLMVATVAPVWLLTCCDFGNAPIYLAGVLQIMSFSTLATLIFSVAAPLVLLAMLVTWRLLVTNLYLGVLGSQRVANAVGCAVVVAIILPMAFGGWANLHQEEMKKYAFLLDWLPWVLGALVVAKFSLALWCFVRARDRKLISGKHAWNYFVVWIYGTEILLLIVLAMPVDPTWKKVLACLALLALPLFRISALPLAFMRGRLQ